jgi:REP-associated tyrosine transposase
LRDADRIFFVTVNLHRGVKPFDPSEYIILIDALEGARRRWGFLLCGYALIPQARDALIWPGYPLTISQAIHDVKRVCARHLHAPRGTEGPVWQHQFWDRFVRHAREFDNRLAYMHLNPVRRGLVAKPEEWDWSSYNNFALDKAVVAACPLQVDYVHLSEGYRASGKGHGQKNSDRGYPLPSLANG